MELRQCILTKNRCYQRGATIVPKGVMVHSTGANNPNLRRYVQPDDGILGVNPYENDWNRPELDVCVHAFIGRKADGGIAAYQTLPWNRRGWHCGGSGNDTHISFEICEDNLSSRDYFEKVYREAVELTAYLCKLYRLNPLADGVVLDHAEGYRRGIASGHSDVGHWFPKFGKTMNDFRNAVAEAMKGEEDLTKAEVQAMIDANNAKLFGTMDSKDRAAVSANNEVLLRTVDQKISAALIGEGTQPSPWATEELAEAIARGITDGQRPGGYATREEAAVMVVRAVQPQKTEENN